MTTKKATTTFRVKRLPITREQFVDVFRGSYASAGFPNEDSIFRDEADELLRLAAALPADAVIEKRGRKMQARRRAS